MLEPLHLAQLSEDSSSYSSVLALYDAHLLIRLKQLEDRLFNHMQSWKNLLPLQFPTA
jgi:hypothetical protein